MQFYQPSLDCKLKYLDAIKEKSYLIKAVLDDNLVEPYTYEECPRIWSPGGGANYYKVCYGKDVLFLKVKHKSVTVESKLEEEKDFIKESSIANEYNIYKFLLEHGADYVPGVLFLEERENFVFSCCRYVGISLKQYLEKAGIEDKMQVWRKLYKTVEDLFNHGIVHTDLHENNIRIDTEHDNKVILVDMEESRFLKQNVSFEQSLDYIGKNKLSELGEYPNSQTFNTKEKHNCLVRLKEVLKLSMLVDIKKLIEACYYDSSNGICRSLDHGKSDKVYQSIVDEYIHVQGQRTDEDKRIDGIMYLCRELMPEKFTYVDVGSNNGLFVRKMMVAHPDIRCIGLEGFDQFNRLARALAFLEDCDHAEYYDFLCGEHDLETLGIGGDVFFSICSVWHHIQNKNEFLSQIKRTNFKYIFLEMAVQEECYEGKSWQSEITYISRYLQCESWDLLANSKDYHRPLILIQKKALSSDVLNKLKKNVSNIIENKKNHINEGAKMSNFLAVYQNAINWIHRYSLPQNTGKAIVCNSQQLLGYPEVTGYYIPSLIRWGYRSLAKNYMEWLLNCQAANGAWMDIHGKSPYVFDTAQVLKGLLAIRGMSPSSQLDTAIRRGCDWILSNMHENGRLTTPDMTDWGSNPNLEIIHLYCISPLYEAAKLLHEPRYQQAADIIKHYYMTERMDWIMNFRLLSHFYAYVMEALLDIGEIETAKAAMEKMAGLQTADGAIPAYRDVHWVCSTGLFQLAMVWFRLGDVERGNLAFAFACNLQNNSGGWYGSYPSATKFDSEQHTYFPQSEISWAIKFFLDALYYKVRTEFEYYAPQFLPTIEKNDGRYQLILQHAQEKHAMKILDIGCGKGRYIKNLLEDVPQNTYYGVDISKEVLSRTTANFKKQTGSLTNIPFPDNFLDMVYSAEAMEHAIDMESAVREMARVTKDGGLMVVIDKNTEQLGRLQLAPLEQWLNKDGFSQLMGRYCSEVILTDNIMYEGRKDGLFSAWIGRVDKKLCTRNSPLVSIVLPVYNGERYLRASIESILGQTLTDWELIIVNDCSTDGTRGIIEEYAALDKRIHAIHNESNQKLPRSLNIGFSAARGRYLSWTSDDNMYLPQALEKMQAFLAANANYAMITARMTIIDDFGRFIQMSDVYNPSWMFLHNTVGACFMYRASALYTIGCYDSSRFLVEDYEYWLRILETCGPIGFLPDVLYAYRRHATSLTAQRREDIAKQLQTMRKAHFPYILQNLKGNILALHYLYDAFLRDNTTDDSWIQNKLKGILPGIERERFDFPESDYIILGTGPLADELLGVFGEKVKFFSDINPSTLGQSKAGRKIISFANVLKYVNAGMLLIIAVPLSQNYEVIRQATNAGLPEYRTYWGYQRKK